MSEELYKLVIEDIKARSTWETKQTTWYQMRHAGLRRRNKAPWQADLHFPLADSIIEKLKPFYFQQLFGTETLASFISEDRKYDAYVSEIGYWFDYKLKQESNLEHEILTAIDGMLMTGIQNVKVFWDHEKKRLVFDAIDPIHSIVPWYTQGIQDGDRFTHVHEISVEQYKQNKNYNQDPVFIKRITGKGSGQDGTDSAKDQAKYSREGLTVASSDNLILFWEVFERTGNSVSIHTFSPLEPKTPIRKEIGLPYDHKQIPFVCFQAEVKDKGYYSSRGIPEKVAPFETALCKMWNEKHDYMTFCNKPLFTSEREIPNGASLSFEPGKILPYGVNRIPMGDAPVSFDQESINIRMVAEQLIMMPDFGQGQQINTRERKTATEVNSIAAIANQGVDLRARIFRRALGELYKQAWSLLKQYDKETKYRLHDEAKSLNKEALNGLYSIIPNGSGDSWNKEARLQKAVARKQLFTGSPYINQGELEKSILELDDPKLVQRLYVDPNKEVQDQYKAQSLELPALVLGAPISPNEYDKDEIHIKCLLDFIEAQGVTGVQPPSPQALQAINAHMMAHMQRLRQANPQLSRQVEGEIKAMMERQSQPPQEMAPQEEVAA